jgi:trimeric autotransporter adhesin
MMKGLAALAVMTLTVFTAVAAADVSGRRVLYAGGTFQQAGGVSAVRVARWNGTEWRGLGAGLSSDVRTLATFRGTIYAGGAFTTSGGTATAYVAQWNGTAWGPVGGGVSATVYALAANGTTGLFVGGIFSLAGGAPATYVAQWNGTAWAPVGDGVSATVYALALDARGSLYVGGLFSSAGPVSAPYVARWDGVAWSALRGSASGTTLDGSVYALTWYADALYIAGGFTSPTRLVARWDGTEYGGLGTGLAGSYGYALVGGCWAQAAGPGAPGAVRLCLGGSLSVTTSTGDVTANLASWNGTAWDAIDGSGATNTVRALVAAAAANDTATTAAVYIGGSFTAIGGVAASRVARWDGTAVAALGTGADTNTVFALLIACDPAWAGATCDDCADGFYGPTCAACAVCELHGACVGSGDTEGQCVCDAGWAGAACETCAPGYFGATCLPCSVCAPHGQCEEGLGGVCVCDVGWAGANCSVCAVGFVGAACDLCDLGFYGVNCTDCAVCAVHGTCLDGRNGSCVCDPGWAGATCAACAPDTYGPTCATCALCRSHGACIEGVSGRCVCDPGWSGVACTTPGGVVVGGDFTGTPAYVAVLNGTAGWAPLVPGAALSGSVYGAVVHRGYTYLVGTFTQAGSLVVNRVARWDGGAWAALGSGVSSSAYAVAVYEDLVYVGGGFSTAGGVGGVGGTAVWNGTAWRGLGTGVDSVVYALTVCDGGALVAGGSFYAAGGSYVSNVASWDGRAWSTLADGLDGTVYALASYQGDVYAGGIFTACSYYSACWRLARWDGRQWSAPAGWGVDGNRVSALAVLDGTLYVGGDFFGLVDLADGSGAYVRAVHVARYDGRSSWEEVGGGVGNAVRALAPLDGSLYAAGSIYSSNGNGYVVMRWDTAQRTWATVSTALPSSYTALAAACPAGRIGPGCAVCDGGFFATASGACVACTTCALHGQCGASVPGGRIQCVCAPGWQGSDCSTATPASAAVAVAVAVPVTLALLLACMALWLCRRHGRAVLHHTDKDDDVSVAVLVAAVGALAGPDSAAAVAAAEARRALRRGRLAVARVLLEEVAVDATPEHTHNDGALLAITRAAQGELAWAMGDTAGATAAFAAAYALLSKHGGDVLPRALALAALRQGQLRLAVGDVAGAAAHVAEAYVACGRSEAWIATVAAAADDGDAKVRSAVLDVLKAAVAPPAAGWAVPTAAVALSSSSSSVLQLQETAGDLTRTCTWRVARLHAQQPALTVAVGEDAQRRVCVWAAAGDAPLAEVAEPLLLPRPWWPRTLVIALEVDHVAVTVVRDSTSSVAALMGAAQYRLLCNDRDSQVPRAPCLSLSVCVCVCVSVCLSVCLSVCVRTLIHAIILGGGG